ncbi:hypothetical protein FRC06_001326 [Ceratobasidium sp. 370]|nr:hypothetical protein FRC06_001326 [Ceratobasidium sp. 370]
MPYSPAKRRRVGEAPATTSNPPTSTPGINIAKSEGLTEPLPDPSRDQVTTGTKFITYDRYPKCHFSCGRPAKEVLNNRRSVKGTEVRALQKQGFVVGAVFIRDDGIAIDWSLPPGSKVNEPIPSAETPVPQPETPRVDPPLLSPQHHASPPSSSEPLHLRLDPLATSAHTPPAQRPTTPTSTGVAYREVPIPPRCLPLRGDTRRLEIWVVEQMHLLEAELGPALVLQPELLGIGEYLTDQHVPNDVAPRVRIRYERPACIVSEGLRDTIQTTSRDATSVAHNSAQPQASSNPPSLIHPTDVGPPIAYLPQSPSPGPRDHDTSIVKAEHDELVLDPPSPCPMPHLAPPDALSAEGAGSSPNLSLGHSMQSPLNGNPLDKRTTLHGGESPCPEPIPIATAEIEEIQRLRRDLEASRLEAERKHKNLEQRILELSRKYPEAGTPQTETSSITVPKANTDSPVQIADESKSKLLVLRRGKHDKTRRLLAPSRSMVLHVSWLGVLQMIDQNTRQIIATGFEEGAPDAVSVEDACSLSESSVALALAGNDCQLGIATLGEKNFKYLPLSAQPHEAKGICAVVPVNSSEVLTLGHNHSYAHWRFDQDTCSTTPLPIPKLHQCTALAYEPAANNVITAGSDSGKRCKLGVYSLLDSQRIPTTVDLSNHVYHIHTDTENPSLLILEVMWFNHDIEPIV